MNTLKRYKATVCVCVCVCVCEQNDGNRNIRNLNRKFPTSDIRLFN
jgi:hypothetical protein